jgi:hypothetical protein
MKLSRSPRGEDGPRTPTPSRKRERGNGSLSPGIGGEGWGEGALQKTAAEFHGQSGGRMHFRADDAAPAYVRYECPKGRSDRRSAATDGE